MELVNVDDVARMLCAGARTVWRMRDMGAMPVSVNLGRSVRWRRSDIEAWIADGCPDVRRTKWTPTAAGCGCKGGAK